MFATTACSHCQNGHAATDPTGETAAAPVCLVCEMRRTQQGLEQELSATWQALGGHLSR